MHSLNRPKKLPKNYRLVFEVVCAQPAGVHAPASEIYAEARRRQAGIGCSTVYRALDRLCEAGLVHEVRVPGMASALYEAARSSHAHFRCTGCGAVEDVDYGIPAGDIAGLSQRFGIAIEDVSLTFNGRCRGCGGRAGR
jgi:Fe2+ or Zn2+ uptake regulation protein